MKISNNILLKTELSLKFPTGVAVSASGRYIAYSEQVTLWQDNRYSSRFLVQEVAKPQLEMAMEDVRLSCSPQWSPLRDELAFALINKGGSELHVLQPGDKEEQKVFQEVGVLQKIEWSPTFRTVVAVIAKRRRGACEYYSVDSPSSLLALVTYDLARSRRSSIALKDVYSINDISISPTGSLAVVTACPSPDPRDQRSYLYQIQLKSGRLSCLIGSGRSVFSPRWSSDGRKVAYLERKGAWNDLGGAEIKTLSLATSVEHSLGQWEYFSKILAWQEAGLLVAGQRWPRKLDLYKCSTSMGRCFRATHDAAPMKHLITVNGGACAYVRCGAKQFPDIVAEDLESANPRRVTNYCRQLNSLYQGKSQVVSWRCDGVKVEGVFVVPSKTPNRPPPVVIVLHGGPVWFVARTAFNTYIDRWTPYPIRSWLQSGFSVFFPNYRGSSGYGEQFRTAIRGRLGQLESRDILSGLQHLVDKELVDERRAGVAGWSYGGYLAAVLLTHHPERFMAASVGAGFSDIRLQFYQSRGNLQSYLTSDPLDLTRHGGFLTPLSKTTEDCPPTLIQHGARDEIVPLIQSHALHRHLKARGNKVRMVVYSDCGHVLDKPRQMLQAKKHNLSWFLRHLRR